MWAPQIEQIEALTQELNYFAECILQDKTPVNDGHAGLRIVRMLEAANLSIRKRGELVRL
jgi:predicted dehydrogenase